MRRVRLLLIGLCLALGPGAALARAPDTLSIDRLTSNEVRDAIAAGTTSIIVPTGGTEQNGPHMALGKHNVRVAVMADRIARQLGDTLVAPVLAYAPEGNIDPPEGHMRFPGTISLPAPVFQQIIEATARSLKQAGFRNIILLGDSGPNQAPQEAAAAALNAEWAGSAVKVHAIREIYLCDAEAEKAALIKMGIRPDEIGGHADVRDTSRLMAIDPTLVRMDKLQAGDGKNGVVGDPRRASAAIGRMLNDRVVSCTVAAIGKSSGK
jgi:creatinine amidohydrolase/Fe(II)-dependent formamide hydrolase-like protein